MDGHWSVLAALKAGREQIRMGTSDCAMGAIRALRAEVPAPVRDAAYFSLMDTAMRAGDAATLGVLATHDRAATLAMFDATIGHLTSKLH
jgi:hypothetical protein